MIPRLTDKSWDNIAQDEADKYRTNKSSLPLKDVMANAIRRAVGVHKAYTRQQLLQLATEVQSKKCGASMKALLHALVKDFE